MAWKKRSVGEGHWGVKNTTHVLTVTLMITCITMLVFDVITCILMFLNENKEMMSMKMFVFLLFDNSLNGNPSTHPFALGSVTLER